MTPEELEVIRARQAGYEGWLTADRDSWKQQAMIQAESLRLSNGEVERLTAQVQDLRNELEVQSGLLNECRAELSRKQELLMQAAMGRESRSDRIDELEEERDRLRFDSDWYEAHWGVEQLLRWELENLSDNLNDEVASLTAENEKAKADRDSKRAAPKGPRVEFVDLGRYAGTYGGYIVKEKP